MFQPYGLSSYALTCALLRSARALRQPLAGPAPVMCTIVLDVCYGPVFSESLLGFEVSSGEFGDNKKEAARCLIRNTEYQ